MLTATADPAAAVHAVLTPAVRWRDQTVASSSYVAFRVAFGLLVAVGQLRFIVRGWVDEFYLSPARHLTYPGFEWVRPLPSVLMYGLVGGLGVLGLLIAAGRRARFASALFALGFGYCELIDAGLYLNHYWFMTLAATVFAIASGPAGGRVSVVTLWALRLQLGVVYLFAGVAKMNADWLLRAEPLHTWLGARTDRPLVGAWLDEPFVAHAFSWAGAVFDLTIVFWLLWHRSRPIAYAVLVVFHLMTAALFQIGMFPWVMIALTPIFFAPTWAERFQRTSPGGQPSPAEGPRVGIRVRWPTVVVLGLLVVANLIMPLRHLAADGNVRWNDDGYLLAWRVMLTERSTHVTFRVADVSAESTFEVAPDWVLDDWQVAAATGRADLILSTAHLIADELRPVLGNDVEVRADVFVAWNGHLRTRWIDPTVNLAALDRSAPASSYALDEPER